MAVKTVHDLGGSANLLEILGRRPVRGARNWAAALALVRAGYAEARSVPEPGQDAGEEHWWTLTITNRGRRKLAAYRGRFA